MSEARETPGRRSGRWLSMVTAGSLTGVIIGVVTGALAGMICGPIAGYEGPNLLGIIGIVWAGVVYGVYGLLIGVGLGGIVGGVIGLVVSLACLSIRHIVVNPIVGVCLGILLAWHAAPPAAEVLQPMMEPTARMQRHARLTPPDAIRWGTIACGTLAGLAAGAASFLAHRIWEAAGPHAQPLRKP